MVAYIYGQYLLGVVRTFLVLIVKIWYCIFVVIYKEWEHAEKVLWQSSYYVVC